MGNQAPRPAQVPHKFKFGDIVVFKPSWWCPTVWQNHAEIFQGQHFQYIANAQGWAGETLVLLPWSCSQELFPGCQLAAAECLMAEEEWRFLTDRDAEAKLARELAK